ncbi:MAG TPA: phosphoribosylanthranilate isomerase [Polyangia bacterium]|jgi:phosphoribosylanthranilate isomerase|nr:phosphoribosylanthranilate isomerase [Polyangia bacterium]
MTWVKICGITTVDDALACVEAGADAIGLNFWPRSKRHRPPDELYEMGRALATQPRRIERWGVFVDPTAEEIEAAFAAGAIDVAQLHGDEDPTLCTRLGARAVKALRLAGIHSLAEFDRYPGDRFLIDAPFAGYGGSGQLVDEQLAHQATLHAAPRRIILAGGLDPDNVAGVIARVRPHGVDVASGVEARPGVKDHERVRRFVAAAKGQRSVP